MIIYRHDLLNNRLNSRCVEKVLLGIVVCRSRNNHKVYISVNSIRWVLNTIFAVIPHSMKIKVPLPKLCLREVLLDVFILNRRNPFIQVIGLLFDDVHGRDRVFL